MTTATFILHQIENGDRCAVDDLLPLVYDELRQLAAQRMSHEKPGQTLQATALVHEAYLRLVGNDQGQRWDSRGHFFSAAAEAMRRILIERARHKKSHRAGGKLRRVAVAEFEQEVANSAVDILALDEVLKKLSRIYPRKAELVKLRFFAGLTIDQAAHALDIAPSTAIEDWAFAKCWLRLEMSESD